MQIKQGSTAMIPVRLVSKADGSGLANVARGSVTLFISKNGGAPASRVLAADEWYEPSAANMPGIYWLKVTGADTDVPGFLVFSVTTVNAMTFAGLVEVFAALALDAKISADAAKDAAIEAKVAAENAGGGGFVFLG